MPTLVEPVTHCSQGALPLAEKNPWEHTQNELDGSGCSPLPHVTADAAHWP
jgi:hypothetical protein